MLSRTVAISLLCLLSAPVLAADCPPLLKAQGELQQLRSKERIDLCQRFAGKPLLVGVNLSSYLIRRNWRCWSAIVHHAARGERRMK